MLWRSRSFQLSLLLHASLVAAMFVSVNFSADPVATNAAPQVITATFIDAQAIENKRQAEAAAAAAAAEKAEQEKRKREAAAKKRREAKAKQEAEQAAERKRQQLLKLKAAEQARKKKEREKAEREEALRKEQAAQEQAELERLMNEQLEQERAAQQARRTQQVVSEVDKYRAMIQQTIMRYLFEDPDFKGKRCRLNIRLASTGLVSQVTIRDGDSALCRAAQSAVLRPDKLPVSSDPDVYEQLKNINLTVEL